MELRVEMPRPWDQGSAPTAATEHSRPIMTEAKKRFHFNGHAPALGLSRQPAKGRHAGNEERLRVDL